ncbi:DUF1793-domain-containing protein [Schizopora paradoxa]|uniref:DUF1793-domain-containing protein n=1 Tax=Schizopora paradoxa TaxID=27342 RepID=A0A0H2R9N9_9AGAM|nr:DUF1793-domain-containing protein [Schizopora paradoxa]
MLRSITLFLSLLFFSALHLVQAIVWTPFYPVSLPVAVKSPYLNVWLPQGNQTRSVQTSWPFYWPSVNTTLGWESILVVDNVPYWIMGVGKAQDNFQLAEFTAASFTPSRTTFNLTAGPVNVQLEWLSPVEVDDLVRLSIPFVYYHVIVTSTDGKEHDVRVGFGFSAGLISGDHTLAANGSSIVNDDVVALQMQLQTPKPFVEVSDHPEDAVAYIATSPGAGVSYQISNGSDSFESAMANATSLSNTVDSNYSSHALNAPFDNFGIMINIGNVNDAPSSAVYAVGVVRDPTIKYTDLSGNVQLRHPYFKANFSSPNDLLKFVVDDFNRSLASAQTFDNDLIADATNISSLYADLLSATTRQSLSGLDVTISQAADGSFNTSDVQIYVKDMGGVGSGGFVIVLYSSLPMYLYLAPELLAHLLYPLLNAQDDPQYTQPYAAQHLGVAYPNATAQNAMHNYGVEETANMLIITLAHAQATKDYSLISNFYNLLSGWTTYLINNSLTPNFQLTNPFDGISSANQTNLALKGVIGIAAMGSMSTFVGKTQDADTYNAMQSTASSYIQQWLALSRSSDGSRIFTSFGDQTSSGLLYNLFADRLLGLNLVPQSVYSNQTSLYRSMQGLFGSFLPKNSTKTYFLSDWTMFTAAICTDNSTRDSFVSSVHQVASTTSSNMPLGVFFNPSSDAILGGTNRCAFITLQYNIKVN